MADEAREGDGDTAAATGISSHREIKPAGDSIDGVDFISSLPDVILQHMLSLIPTKFAIRTTVLSTRWRHVWSNTPSLYFDGVRPTLISQTLGCYRAPKMTSFHIWNLNFGNAPQIDSWIEFAISRKVEKLSLVLNLDDCKTYRLSDSFFVNPCLKQLELRLHYCKMIPRCSVFWSSLRRHVWSETPQLSFEWLNVSSKSINKTLASYSAPRITSFHLCTRLASRAHHVNSWIEFAMSHKVENLSLEFRGLTTDYSFPDFFYSNSSLKQLIVDSGCNKMIPTCIVAWTSLKSLSLCSCRLSDESSLKILSGCPILESLSLQFCYLVKYLDLSKSMCLTSLEIDFCPSFRPIQIVAPHIHYLRLRNSEPQTTMYFS